MYFNIAFPCIENDLDVKEAMLIQSLFVILLFYHHKLFATENILLTPEDSLNNDSEWIFKYYFYNVPNLFICNFMTLFYYYFMTEICWRILLQVYQVWLTININKSCNNKMIHASDSI